MRLFISVQFTEPMINALEAFQSRLKASGVEGYFAVRENLHLTLAFIGEVIQHLKDAGASKISLSAQVQAKGFYIDGAK